LVLLQVKGLFGEKFVDRFLKVYIGPYLCLSTGVLVSTVTAIPTTMTGK
jgi:hypothetical protein